MKKVFKYMGYKTFPLNGDFMALAINAMRERGDWDSFSYFVYHEKMGIKQYDKDTRKHFMPLLFGNPQKFFELMEEWLVRFELVLKKEASHD